MTKEVSMSKGQANGIMGEMYLPCYLMRTFNFVANKIEHDFGFDFDVNCFNENSESTGLYIKAQCKEVESGDYKYAKLEEKHMRLYLRTRQVICVFGIDLENNLVQHRFFDKELAEKFIEALKKGQAQICLNFETDLRPESEFLNDLYKASDQSIQNQLYEFISEKLLQEKIPDAQIEVFNSSKKTVLKISSPYITDMLNPLLLGNGPQFGKMDDFICADCLGIIKDRYRGVRTFSFGGVAVTSSKSKLKVGKTSLEVSVWPRRQNMAYVMACGFSFEFGSCQVGEEGKHYHPCLIGIEKSVKPFFDYPDDVAFFEKAKLKDAVYFDNVPMIPCISEWERLDTITKVIKEVILLRKELPDLFENFYLANLNDEKYWNNIQVLYQLLMRKKELYILEGVFKEHDPQKNVYQKEIQGFFPIFFTLDRVYRLIFSCSYSLVRNNGEIVGVAVGRITKVDFEIAQDEEFSSFPKINFDGVNPPIPIEDKG
ncbi:MAG: hypothetical protein MJZ22_02310 [Candidatus Saccharibacteria bacterium]|nr:hypothetical protein [Candidatus Saccharibacteria bacterium]